MSIAYSSQLAAHFSAHGTPWLVENISTEFHPENSGRWLYERLVDWSEKSGHDKAGVHVFRKTHLQTAVDGDQQIEVAKDAGVTPKVITDHYLSHADQQLRLSSNRIYQRLIAGLPRAVLQRYGHTPEPVDPLIVRLEEALRRQDWNEVKRLGGELHRRDKAG